MRKIHGGVGAPMSKSDWRELTSLVGAGLVVVGLVTWSVVANILDVDRPWTPLLPGPEWFQVAIGFAGLIGLYWTVIFARRAWREAKRSADAAHDALADTRKDAAEQASRFEKQLQVAVTANKEFAEFSQRQSRAYMVLQDAEAGRVVDPDNPGRFFVYAHLSFRNKGQTPAFDCTTRARVQVASRANFLDVPLPPEPTSRSITGPDVEATINTHLTPSLSVDDVIAAHQSGQTLWIRGIIGYRDIYGVEWQAHFCQRADSFGALINDTKITFTADSEGNLLKRMDDLPM